MMWQRIRAARMAASLTQEKLGDLCGVSKAAVAQWEAKTEKNRTSPSRENLYCIHQQTGAPMEWLMDNNAGLDAPWMRAAEPVNDHAVSDKLLMPSADAADNNVTDWPSLHSRVPIISSTQAGEWREIVDNYSPGDGEDWIETTVPIKAHTYALRVEGDSMLPEFPPGCIIIVEPEMPPEPGDYVVVRLNGDSTFKQLIKDGSDWYLRPLNDRYPIKPMPEEAEFCGVVRGMSKMIR